MVQTDCILNAIVNISSSVSFILFSAGIIKFVISYLFACCFRIVLLKRLVAWFFQRKLNRNANQLKTLRTEKKKIIEQVMDKETYKV